MADVRWVVCDVLARRHRELRTPQPERDRSRAGGGRHRVHPD